MTASPSKTDSASPAAHKSRRSTGKRIALGGAGVLAVIVVAAVLAEIAGWPFLAGPMQNALSKALDRPVYLEGAMAPEAVHSAANASGVVGARPASSSVASTRVAGGVRLKLLGRIELRAHRIEIAAPDWSKGAPLLVAENSKLQLRYGDLWRASRGETLRVRRIEADTLDMSLERLADGRASWQFGKPKPADADAKPVAIPVFEDVRVNAGRMELRDAMLDSELSARFSLVDGTTVANAMPAAPPAASAAAGSTRTGEAPPSGLRAEATGRYQKLPVKLSLQTVGVLPWVAEEAASVGVPLTVDGQIGKARLRFNGSVKDAQRMAGLAGKFSLSGPSLASVGDVIGVTLPTTGAFTTRGILTKNGEVWSTRIDEALIGRSSLTAALRYDPTQATPLLAGRISGSRLLLADLGPTIGTAPVTPEGKPVEPVVAAQGRVLPDREFDLPSLRAMNANILFDFAELNLNTKRLESLEPFRTHLVLDGGVLELRDIDARTADGRLQGKLSLDGRESVAVYRTDLRWSQVKLEQWLQIERANGAPPYISGRLDGRAKLEGRGRSTAQILASLNGELRGRVRDGTLSHLAIEAGGIDIAQVIGVVLKGDESLKLDCALADLRVDKGVATPRVLVFDTSDSTAWIDGSVSLSDESMNLHAVVSPKDFSPLTLRTPIKVTGTLGDPKVALETAPLVRKLAAAGVLALINPIAAWLPLLDFGSDETPANAGGCKALAARVAERQAKAGKG